MKRNVLADTKIWNRFSKSGCVLIGNTEYRCVSHVQYSNCLNDVRFCRYSYIDLQLLVSLKNQICANPFIYMLSAVAVISLHRCLYLGYLRLTLQF